MNVDDVVVEADEDRVRFVRGVAVEVAGVPLFLREDRHPVRSAAPFHPVVQPGELHRVGDVVDLVGVGVQVQPQLIDQTTQPSLDLALDRNML